MNVCLSFPSVSAAYSAWFFSSYFGNSALKALQRGGESQLSIVFFLWRLGVGMFIQWEKLVPQHKWMKGIHNPFLACLVANLALFSLFKQHVSLISKGSITGGMSILYEHTTGSVCHKRAVRLYSIWQGGSARAVLYQHQLVPTLSTSQWIN